MQEISDDKLIKAVSKGDKEAFLVLHNRHHGIVLSLARSILRGDAASNDIVQETFLTLWKRAHLYFPEKGSVRAWLLTICRNKCLDYMRKNKSRTEYFSENPFEQAVKEKLYERGPLDTALNKLSPEHRVIIFMSYYQDMSQSEIAQELGIPLGTVKSRARLGMKKLRELYRKEADG